VHHLADAGHLRAQLFWHGRSMRLILRILFVAEGAPHVEGHGNVVGLLVPQHVKQHGGEAEDGIGQLALARRHCGRQGVEGTIGQAVAINEYQFLGHRSTSRRETQSSTVQPQVGLELQAQSLTCGFELSYCTSIGRIGQGAV
jgi:hypothetical protein